MRSWLLLVLIIYGAECAKSHLGMRIVDLTHAHNSRTIYWPGNPEFNFTILSRGQTQNGYWYESNYFGTPEHGGTHLDAPAHFYEGAWRAQQIPMDRLIGPGVIIDVTQKASSDPDYRVTVQDLRDWEKSFGKIPFGAIVIMNSGWDKHYPNKSMTFGTDTPSNPATFHFPGFHQDAADWLVRYRHIYVVGVDTPSTDYGQSKSFPVHVILGKANIPGLENVANLGKIPQSGAMIYVGAVKLSDGSGGPARTFATIPEGDDTSTTQGLHSTLFIPAFVVTTKFLLSAV